MSPKNEAYPRDLQEAENRRLIDRRAGVASAPLEDGLAGVGISGGGIRSATFALGFFQGLAKDGPSRERGLIRFFDFMSTVSGGGYFGSFLGRLFTRDYVESANDLEDVLLQRKRPEVLRFLRENGRYLSPNGGGDSLQFGAAILRNWVAIQVVLLVFLFCLFVGLQLFRALVESKTGILTFIPQEEVRLWWSPFMWLPLGTFLMLMFPLGWAYWLVERVPGAKDDPRQEPRKDDLDNPGQELSAISPIAGVWMVLAIFSALAVSDFEPAIRTVANVIALVAALTWGFWRLNELWVDWDPNPRSGKIRRIFEWLAKFPAKLLRRESYSESAAISRTLALRNRLGKWLTYSLVVTVLLLVVALVDSVGQTAYLVVRSSDLSIVTWLMGILGSIGFAGLGRWLAMFFSKGPQSGRPRISLKILATLAAIVLATGILVSLDCASHAVAWGGATPADAPRLARASVQAAPEKPPLCCTGESKREAMRSPLVLSKQPLGPTDLHIVPSERGKFALLVTFAGSLLLTVLFSQTWPFVNRSSHLPLYGARLTRAYLGASNEKRNAMKKVSVSTPVEDDDIDLAGYWRCVTVGQGSEKTSKGAPIHLINVTINETIDAVSQIEQQDRKGIGLALGPCGWSAGIRHHLLIHDWDTPAIDKIYPEKSNEYRIFRYAMNDQEGKKTIFPGESLTLGRWLAISGAAFSTGTGMRTSLGMSFLAGFANVRLGHWWDSGLGSSLMSQSELMPKRKVSLWLEDGLARLLPVQTHLLDEFLARFPGAGREHWYLSDGGHFENMGGYELIRRRLRFILVLDAEMDGSYTFGGLANLVRKARLDFGAEINFLSASELDEVVTPEVRPYVGTLQHLRRGEWEVQEKPNGAPAGILKKPDLKGHSLAYAALARVTYSASKEVSWLLYVKPALTGNEPTDLLEYHGEHPEFPHQTTGDQFFDEAQWESYRRLGDHIAEKLFAGAQRLVPEGPEGRGTTVIEDWDWFPGKKRPVLPPSESEQ